MEKLINDLDNKISKAQNITGNLFNDLKEIRNSFNNLKEAINYTRCCTELSKRPNTSSTWECFSKEDKQKKGNV